jgi:hypothetical protein
MTDLGSDEHHYVFTIADPDARSVGGLRQLAQIILMRIFVTGVVAWGLLLAVRAVSDTSPYFPLYVIGLGMLAASVPLMLIVVARARSMRRRVLDAGLPVAAANRVGVAGLRAGMWVPSPHDLRRCGGPKFAPMFGRVHAHRITGITVGPDGYSIETTGGTVAAPHSARSDILDFDPVCGWDRNEEGHAGLRPYLAPGWGDEPLSAAAEDLAA